MDVLIEKGKSSTQLSSLGLLVLDFQDTSPMIELNKRTVTGRNGSVYAGARFTEKTIKVSGRLFASSNYHFEEKKDEINALLSDVDPFYITKMITDSDSLYDFERPGQCVSDLDLLSLVHKPYKYRYKVTINGNITYSFLGKSTAGLLFNFTVSFTTTEMPFGQTIPIDKAIDGDSIEYKGSAKCSQLEYPWYLKLTSNQEQAGSFTVAIGERTFSYTSSTKIKQGDIFLLKGIENTANGVNVNNYTNYEHFELLPSEENQNAFSTTFMGAVQLINFIEFYK